MTPLCDLLTGEYLGFPGGLYPGGQNSRPLAYEQLGIALAARVQPLDKEGKASAAGRIALLAIGMSNTSHEFSRFMRLVAGNSRINPKLVLIDAAVNGASAKDIAVASGDYWLHVKRQLERAETWPGQVQAVWLKTALAHEAPGFPEKARLLQQALRSIVQILRRKLPQLKLVYLSSRTYGGYSETDLSPEPIAYESGFAVKWLIEERISDERPEGSTPWLSWGPYLWANGMRPRKDGFTWERNDFEPDGVHPSEQGALKVATSLLQFFENDPTARPWFLSASSRSLSTS